MKENKISAVYSITNNVTGDFYIGSSHDVKKRWANHKCPSMWKLQPNSKLYQDMSQYGLDNFIFEVLEETTDLHNREQYYIEQLKPTYNSIRADGWNTERYKETNRQCSKEWYKANRDKELAKKKVCYRRLCLYAGKTLTLNALALRFHRQGIPHAWTEAKTYLIENTV